MAPIQTCGSSDPTPTALSSPSFSRLDEFLNWLEVNGRSHNTIRAYRADLTDWWEWWWRTPTVWTLPVETHAARYLTEHRTTWAPKTTERKLTAIRSFARWSNWPGANGGFLADYRAPAPAKAQPHPLSEGVPGVLAMLDAAGAGDVGYKRRRQALVALVGLCGLRVGEAITIRPRDVDQHDKTVTVRGKGDKTRVVPISGRAWSYIKPAIDQAVLYGGDRTLVDMKQSWARMVWSSLGEQAGLSRHTSSHDGRATFATVAYELTHDIRAVQELLGHSSSDTTAVYTGISERTKRAAVDAVGQIGDAA